MISLDTLKKKFEIPDGEDPTRNSLDAIALALREGILIAYAQNGPFFELNFDGKTFVYHDSEVCKKILERLDIQEEPLQEKPKRRKTASL